jgi:hypothetical protein
VFLGYYSLVPFFLLQPRPPLFSLPARRRRSAGHVQHPRHPRTAQGRATCRLSPVPPFPRAALASPRRATPPVVCPSRSSPPLAVAATRSAPPPAPHRSHASLPGRPLPYPSPLPSSARATPTPSLPELRRGRHARRRSLTLPLTRCVLFSNLKHVLSPQCILSFAPATIISPTFLSPNPAPHRTSAAPPGHRHQPPTPPPVPDPVLLEHHRDSLQLINPPNSIFSNPSVVPHSAGELPAPSPLGLLSTRRHRAVPPLPKAPTAPHQSVEAPRLLSRHPPASQLAERRAAIAAGKNPSRPTVDRHLLTRL